MVSRTEVEKIAKLAKLSFTDTEYDALTGELNNVLGYIDQLKELDVAGVQPLENLNEAIEESALRPDIRTESLPVDMALKNAPKSADNYFLVPKVLEQTIKNYVETDLVGDEEEELG
jgi:aspartyl-tRNA(Asn)/glutamyl-tRNA(Gln) amidotransferase subunit C